MTPEGLVKKKINKLLDEYSGRIYYYMPVPCGYGKATLDYLGCFYGFAFAIEAKRSTKKPTPRQEGTIEDMEAAGMVVFRIRDEVGLLALQEWLRVIWERMS